MLEGKIQDKVLDYLKEAGFFVFRTNNTPTWDPKLYGGRGGYRAQGKHSTPGLADALMVLEPHGQLVGVEFKTKTGRQSADQKLFERRLKRAGGEYFIIRSIDDAKEMVAELST